MKTPISHRRIAIILAMTMALGPLALDTYLPAFPVIAQSLDVSMHQVSLTISIYIFFLAIGQLCGGPLSDHFGRSRIMFLGLGIFAFGSFLLAYAETLPEFIVLRILQAFGGGWATVAVPALIRDRLSGKEAAKFFSLMGLFMVITPVLAPNIGALIVSFFGWPSIFVFLGTYALLVMSVLKLMVFKGNQELTRIEKVSVWQRYKEVISNRSAMRFMIIGSFAFSILLLFITHSSFIYQQHFDLEPHQFSILFSANVLLMLLANLVNRKLLNYFASNVILKWSLTLQFIAVIILITLSLLHPQLIFIVPAIVLTIGLMGAISPNIQACYMEYFSKNGGTAAALFGATKFSLAGLISAASTLLPESIFFVVLTQAFCSLLCVILIWTIQK